MNSDLAAYLGHDELQPEVRDDGYRITRCDEPVKKDIDGETTAIALLYFFESLSDGSFDRKKGVVDIDGPLLSGPSNATHMAFGFILQTTEDVPEQFASTEDFTCFRALRNWFKYLEQRYNRTQSPETIDYVLVCDLALEARQSYIRKLEPLLANSTPTSSIESIRHPEQHLRADNPQVIQLSS